MNENLRGLNENLLGGNFPKNQRTNLGSEVENQGEFSIGEFVLVEIPKLEITGAEEMKVRTREARNSELNRYRGKMAGRESILGETFKERVRNGVVSEVLRKYPNLDIAKVSFYLNLIQNGIANDWNFRGCLIAIEKAEPWGWSSFQSRLARRTNMTFKGALGLISENREQILKKIVPEGTNDRLDLSTVELGIPTLEELIYLEAYRPELISLNRGKENSRWTGTTIRLGGTNNDEKKKKKKEEDDENNVIWASESSYHGDFFSMDPNKSDINVGFDIIARFK